MNIEAGQKPQRAFMCIVLLRIFRNSILITWELSIRNLDIFSSLNSLSIVFEKVLLAQVIRSFNICISLRFPKTCSNLMLSSQLHRRVTGTAIVVRVIMEVMIPHLHMTCTIVVSGKRWRTRRMVFMVAGLTMSHFVLSLSLPISTSSLIHSAARCFQMLPDAPRCCDMLPDAAIC